MRAVAVRLVAHFRFWAFSKSMQYGQIADRKKTLLLCSKLCSLSKSFLFVDATGPNVMFAVANNAGRILLIGLFVGKFQI